MSRRRARDPQTCQGHGGQGKAEECSRPMGTKETGRLCAVCALGLDLVITEDVTGTPRKPRTQSGDQTAAPLPGTRGFGHVMSEGALCHQLTLKRRGGSVSCTVLATAP